MALKFTATDVSDEVREALSNGYKNPMARAATKAMRSFANRLQVLGKSDILSGGLGARMSRAFKVEAWPKGSAASLGPAAQMDWSTHAAEIFEEGGTIKPTHGKYVWIPLRGAPKGPGGKHLGPGDLGFKLTMLKRPGKEPLLATQLLVAKGSAPPISKLGFLKTHQATDIVGNARKRSRGKVRITVPLFFGLLSTFLRKRTHVTNYFNQEADALAEQYGVEISQDPDVN